MAVVSQAKHHLLLELGRGGMGTVYLALARGPGGFNKLKVVKRLRADLASDEQFLTMFLDEARLSARLNHPNVVQTNEVGFDGAHYFIEMEYLEGQSFDALLRRAAKAGGLPLEVSLYVLAHTLAGLHYAHEAKDHSGPLRIVHRDVSPHNVFVTYDGAVKVLDFGIAKAADSSTDTTTGVVKGKATYMAPEQAARGTVDRRADVFAVGVMLWETLTRKRMYAGLGDFEIFLALQRGAPPAPRSVDVSIPMELDAICAKALAYKADDRFTSAAEMQLALEDEIAKRTTRVGPRALATVMSDLFGDRRAAVQEEIDGRMREIDRGEWGSTRTSIDVPVLGQAKAFVETSTGPTRTRNLALPKEAATRAAAPGETRAPADADLTPGDASSEGGRTRSAVISDLPPVKRRSRAAALGWIGAAVAVTAAGILGMTRVRTLGLARPATGVIEEAGAEAKGCSTNLECTTANAGRPSLCVRETKRCVPLESDECRLMAEAGDAENEETIWFGLLLPQKGPEGDALRIGTNIIDLARQDFVKTSNGLPPRTPGGRPRPIAVVSCDDGAERLRAARHLADLRVPAVIGFGDARDVVDMYPSIFAPAHTLLVEMINTSTHVTQIPQTEGLPRLVWRVTVDALQCARPLASFVSEWLEPHLAKERASGQGNRVALVRGDSMSSLTVASALTPELRIDGKQVVEATDAFAEVVLSAHASDDEIARATKKIVDFAPTIVIYLVGGFTHRILPLLEGEWPKGRPYRPTYVGAGNVADQALFDFVGTSAARRRRVFSLETPANTGANLRFVLRYNETFAPPLTPSTAPGVDYDAFYLLAFAAVAAGHEDLTGLALAKAIPKLLEGPHVEVGPAAIFEAINDLTSGKTINLAGAGTELDLDSVTGESPSDYAIYCIRPNAAGLAVDAVESGLKYDRKLHALSGQLSCP